MPTRIVHRFFAEERGATAIEYGLIAALIAVALITSLVALGDNVTVLFGDGVGGASRAIEDAMERAR
ncbi:Flp family type IVb pilin [Devosia sp. 1566]|uniref:Flp family type IVb pilin n=1 Tax=Devosia sp. 1566 TaxID=2499144 RepID=UPI000FDA8E0F|nr:Flp family type IVb pilin [Devosia sp. 1566]